MQFASSVNGVAVDLYANITATTPSFYRRYVCWLSCRTSSHLVLHRSKTQQSHLGELSLTPHFSPGCSDALAVWFGLGIGRYLRERDFSFN